MFDLEQAIENWRRQMAAAGTKSPEVLEELECHLRDEVEQRLSSGATAQVAFETAVELLGRPEKLQAEFAKLKAKDGRSGFLRRCCYIFAAFMLLINTWTLLEYEISPAERTLGICAVLLVSLYLVYWPKLLESLPAAAYGLLAKVIKLASGVFWIWPIWALLEAEHIVHSGLGIVANTVLWCLYGALAMTALVAGLNGRARRSGASGGPPPPFQPLGQPIPPTRPPPLAFAVSLQSSQPVDPIVKQALEAAREEASRWGHDYIGTEHVLLGLFRLAQGPFADRLRRMNLDSEAVRAEVDKMISPASIQTERARIPFTPRARKAVKLAAREAKACRHSRLTAEHVFLGLLLEGSGVAAVVLRKLGIHVERAREEILSQSSAHRIG